MGRGDGHYAKRVDKRPTGTWPWLCDGLSEPRDDVDDARRRNNQTMQAGEMEEWHGPEWMGGASHARAADDRHRPRRAPALGRRRRPPKGCTRRISSVCGALMESVHQEPTRRRVAHRRPL